MLRPHSSLSNPDLKIQQDGKNDPLAGGSIIQNSTITIKSPLLNMVVAQPSVDYKVDATPKGWQLHPTFATGASVVTTSIFAQRSTTANLCVEFKTAGWNTSMSSNPDSISHQSKHRRDCNLPNLQT
jgi:hypothetical protein